MNRNRSTRSGKAGIGPRIVRAWFDAVINPMLNSLRAEHALLEHKDWTWQFFPTHLEMIKNVSEYIDRDAVEYLDQLLSFHPSLRSKIEEHDKARSSLFDACRASHSAIVSKSDIEEVYKRATSLESLSKLGKQIKDLFGTYQPSDHVNLLAEYIVNNTGELPYYYTVSPLWNHYRGEFLKILAHPRIAGYYQETIKAGKRLMRSNEVLVRSLRDVREKLSLKYDLPYFDGAMELSLTDKM